MSSGELKIPLHPRPSATGSASDTPNPLPPLLHTPAGLALVELQGTINFPSLSEDALVHDPETSSASYTGPIGRLVFPGYSADAMDVGDTSWMKRVHLYVGPHQRLTGELKKLPKALAVVRRRATEPSAGAEQQSEEPGGQGNAVADDGKPPDALEIAAIVKYKIVFSQRPEPVGTS